jgi:hypothetical protein
MEAEMGMLVLVESAFCTIATWHHAAGATGGKLGQNAARKVSVWPAIRRSGDRPTLEDMVPPAPPQCALAPMKVRFGLTKSGLYRPNYSPSIAILGPDDGADRGNEVIRQVEQVEAAHAADSNKRFSL